jgi:hypothetical protein
MSEPTNAQLATQLLKDADFLEDCTPGGWESTEAIARVRLAAQRLEAIPLPCHCPSCGCIHEPGSAFKTTLTASPLPGDIAGLIERLLKVNQKLAQDGRANVYQIPDPTCEEAATALERMAREIHNADNSHAKTLVEFGKLRVRIAELEVEHGAMMKCVIEVEAERERLRALNAELCELVAMALETAPPGTGFQYRAQEALTKAKGKTSPEGTES